VPDIKETSKPIPKNELETAGVNWNKLKTCLSDLKPVFGFITRNYDIEEEPPTILNEDFVPNSWVGTYPETNLRIVPSKIGEDEYSQMQRDIISWIQTLGSPFFEMLSKCFPTEVMERKTLYRFFSRMLINHTEILLTHQLPREAVVRDIVGREPRGKILWNRMAHLRQRDPNLLALRQTRFTFNTLPNLLLTQFHARLGSGLQEITEIAKELNRNRQYHLEFLGSGLPADLLEDSLDVDFSSPDTLEKARRMSPPLMHDIVDLWESFLSGRAHLLSVSERFDGAIKPMSKVYELWCLKVLYEALKELTNVTPKPPTEFPCIFNFSDLKLHYNKPESSYSGLLTQLGVRPGAADFLFFSNNSLGMVADAKYREIGNIGKEDYQRFLSYLLDYLYPWGDRLEGIIFHLSEDEKRDVQRKGVVIHLFPLRPSNVKEAREEIKALFARLIEKP
jgi:hypothetical protein